MNFPFVVDFGSEVCGSLESASEREWLVTNGLGGFACGTIAGALTRRYHGLLFAVLPPRSSRVLLVSKFDETLTYDGRSYELGANCWADGTVAPKGFRWIQRFHLDGTTAVWTFACADALLEKRIWMQDGANTTFVRYELLRSSGGSADLEIKALVNHRDFHAVTHAGDWHMDVTAVNNGLRVTPREGMQPFYLLSWSAGAEPKNEWYRSFELAEERARGLDDSEDHLFAGVFRARLTPGQAVTIVLSTDPEAPLDGDGAAVSQRTLEEKLVEQWVAAGPQASLDAPPWIRQLVLAAAQFPVRRPLPVVPDAHSLIAGYPWFGEWGRDTMIALPGLTLETGRPELARLILQSSARSIDQGMLPNVFPEGGEEPGYNAVDAALWFVEAVRQYRSATADLGLVGELFDVLAAIIDWYAHGTRYSIRVDESDGLLYAGEAGVQLTWMDARVGDQVITPRTGQAGGSECLVVQRAANHGAIRVRIEQVAAGLHSSRRAGRKELLPILERRRELLLRRAGWAARPRSFGAAQSDICRVAAGEPAIAQRAKSRGRSLRASPGDASRAAEPRSCRFAIRRPLRWAARRARRGLSSGNGLGLAARSVRACASARIWQAGGSVHLSRTYCAARCRTRPWKCQRDF